jgi:hypothetical protein
VISVVPSTSKGRNAREGTALAAQPASDGGSSAMRVQGETAKGSPCRAFGAGLWACLCDPAKGFGDGAADVGGLASLVGVSGKVFAGEGGGNFGLGPTLSASGNTERHICGRWSSDVARRHTEARERDECGVAGGPGSEAETGVCAFLFGLLVEVGQAQVERLGEREGLAVVTGETGERIEALGVAVLRLAVGESGGASEPAPIGGAAVCAELGGERFRGAGAPWVGTRLRVA